MASKRIRCQADVDERVEAYRARMQERLSIELERRKQSIVRLQAYLERAMNPAFNVHVAIGYQQAYRNAEAKYEEHVARRVKEPPCPH